MPLLFVYGTLQRGCRNHRHLAGAIYRGEAATGPGWALYDVGGFPGLVAEPAADAAVVGELWGIGAEALNQLDRIEGVPLGVYARVPLPMNPPAPAVAEAYVYQLGVTGRRRLENRWREQPASGGK